MPPDYIAMYLATLGLCSFFGVLLVETIDRKSDEMAGFRERKIRHKKKYRR